MKKTFIFAALLGASALATAHAQAPAAEPTSQLRPVARFRGIRVGGGIGLTLAAGHEQRVEASAATAEFVSHLRTKVEDGILVISYDDLLERDDRKLLRTDHKLRVTVTADVLTSLAAGSGAAITASGPFAAPDCVLSATSGATVNATGLVADVLVVRETNGSAVTLSGTAPRLDIRASGGSTFDGQQLQSATCQLEASGGSTARVAASKELLIEASGGSVVRYYGAPAVTKDLSGGSTASAK